MRIISGTLKGRNIPSIKNATYRPSTCKVKEAIFSILYSSEENFWHGKSALDLFAGTGSLGFEAISRGADSATFIDIEKKFLYAASEFAESAGIANRVTFLNLDSTNLPNAKMQFNVVFIDPPYMKSLIGKSLETLHRKRWITNDSILVIETSKQEEIAIPDYCNLVHRRIYNNTQLLILKYGVNTCTINL